MRGLDAPSDIDVALPQSITHRDRGLVGVLAAHYSAACTTVYRY
jgi:hypothetical protein